MARAIGALGGGDIKRMPRSTTGAQAARTGTSQQLNGNNEAMDSANQHDELLT